MSARLGAICDEFYVTTRLFLKLDMPLERETVLHFFDRIRKEFPDLSRFRRREDGSLVLEGDRSSSSGRRWLRLDPASLRFGMYDPPDADSVRRFADFILQQAPYHLTFSELDFDHMDVIYGFDLEYHGNHDQLLADTLWRDHPLGGLLYSHRAAHVLDAQPYLGISITPECDLQAYVEIKSRTNTFEIRAGEYEPQPISIYLTARQYWGVTKLESPASVQARLYDLADELAADFVVPQMVNPIAAAISGRA
ncbi:MAG: hypothetical protein KJ057_11650 [Phycisphaerae bacterium]|nr:MAG: hypothetical protein F9K17_08615 [Phycisphaerae bacterium]MBE7457276.1 hypothetical protein [Planctomycetia bacterium]MCK6465492.1 hypothetical protein [Phycisphaerae bacterium]MCL4719115.1 hypothetical protein [Phycisphaerae bacterium]NUQ09175.1 hypothetical protein [Phycisphaerae bacterium]